MKKHRTLIEGPEWEESRSKIEPDAERWDEWFRFAAYNISVAPRVNTTPFVSPEHRILRVPESLTVEYWVYFRIEPDDSSCTLLWVHRREHNNLALRL